MLNFRKLKLSDKDWITKAVNEGDTDGSSYSFGTLYAWGDSYSIEVAEYDGMLLIRGMADFGRYYVYPSGKGDIKGALAAMMEECYADGYMFRLGQILESNKNNIEQLFPDMFDFTYDRDGSEYVYSVENMAQLPGKKFHGKKGHVNAFFRKHSDIRCDPITDDNIHLCLEIEKQWMTEKNDDDGALNKESVAIQTAVKNFKELGFIGAILYADGQPVAFTMGEPLKNSTFCTHYEKTIPEYKDAFPVINNGFTKLMLSSYKYVNREEDTGSPGLRKAKLSYHPEFMVDKYFAVLKNDPARKYKADADDFPDLIKLWNSVFGDDENVIDFFLKNTVKPADIYAYKVDGRIVSAFYLVDADLISGKEKLKTKYLYAAATLPEYRKRGIMGEMIKYAAGLIADNGFDYISLCPDNEHLYDYYAKFGFIPVFKDRYFTISKTQLSEYKGARYFNTTLSYSEMREYIPSLSYIQFSVGYLDYARLLAKKYGFEINAVFDDEDKVFLIGHKNADGSVFVEEAVSSQGNYNHILSVVSDIDADSYVLKTPYDIEVDGFDSIEKYSGMILPVGDNTPDDNIYLGQPCM